MLIPLLFLLVAATGAGVALSRVPRRQVMAMAANGLSLTLLFMALQAPDVAFSELTVGTAAVPLLFLVVLASVRADQATKAGATKAGATKAGATRGSAGDDAKPETPTGTPDP